MDDYKYSFVISLCISSLSIFYVLLFVAVLASFFVAVLARFFSYLFSLLCHRVASRRCSLYFLLAALATFFLLFSLLSSRCSRYFFLVICRYFLVALFVRGYSRCSTSLFLFTLVVTLSFRYSHCLLSYRFFSLFSFEYF